jgi:hypothetical protein
VITPERSRVSKQPDRHTREFWKCVQVKTSTYFSISSCLFLSCSLFSVHVRAIPIRTSFVSHVDDIRNLGVHPTFQRQQESVRFWKVVALFRCCRRHHSAWCLPHCGPLVPSPFSLILHPSPWWIVPRSRPRPLG